MLEVARFLAGHPPFRGLAPEALDEVAGSIQVEFFPPGTPILDQGGEPSSHVYVVRRGSVEVTDGPRVVDILGEGDLFGFPSLLSATAPLFGVRALEETLCYLVDGDHARRVFSQPSGFRFLTLSLRGRLDGTGQVDPPVLAGEVAAGPLVEVGAGDPIAEVARLMTASGSTAAVVRSGTRIGIVTDRDIRARVVAAELPASTPVSEVATIPARTIAPDAPLDEALASMLSLGVHHLPVAVDGTVQAMLTDLDLLGHTRRDAFRLRSEIGRAPDVAAVAEIGQRVPSAIVPLARAGVDSAHIGVVMATLVDALTERLLALAEQEIGPAPGPYAWLSLGSGGRREQAIRTDQDHAIVYADEVAEHDEQFRDIAAFVVDGLEAAGIPRCDSKVMASEEGWRGPATWWRQRIEQWMDVADSKATFLTALVFDARVVAGGLDVEDVLTGGVEQAHAHPSFLNRLTRLIVDMKVPIGFLGGLVVSEEGEHGTLDVKRGGIHPVTEMARLYGLRAGVRGPSTLRRLRAGADAGVVDPERVDALIEAHAVLRDVRLRHQIGCLEAGRDPDDLIDPGDLTAIERRTLRDAFRVVRDAQRHLGEEHQPRAFRR